MYIKKMHWKRWQMFSYTLNSRFWVRIAIDSMNSRTNKYRFIWYSLTQFITKLLFKSLFSRTYLRLKTRGFLLIWIRTHWTLNLCLIKCQLSRQHILLKSKEILSYFLFPSFFWCISLNRTDFMVFYHWNKTLFFTGIQCLKIRHS